MAATGVEGVEKLETGVSMLLLLDRHNEWPNSYSIRSYDQEHMKCFIPSCYYCHTAGCYLG